MRKAKRWREGTILLLPVVAFAGAASWMQSRPPKQTPRQESGPFRLVVGPVEKQAPTPRDVAEGFDTRLAVTLGYQGRAPEAWGSEKVTWSYSNPSLYFRPAKGSQWGWVSDKRHGLRSPLFDPSTRTYQATLLLRLADVPARLGDLRWEADGLQAEQMGGMQMLDLAPSVPLRVPARRAGESIRPPQNVSRFCPLLLRGVKVERVASTPPPFALHVTAELETLDAPPDGRLRLHSVGESFVEDESGRRTAVLATFSYPTHMPANGRTTCTWFFEVGTSPLKSLLQARRLTFHTRLSQGESWPVTIRAVLWDKTPKPAKI